MQSLNGVREFWSPTNKISGRDGYFEKVLFGSGASGCVSPNLPSFFSKVIDMLQECVFKSGKVFDKVTLRKQLIEKLKHMRGPKLLSE